MKALQLDTLIPFQNAYIDIGPCRLNGLRVINGLREVISDVGTIDFHGATLVNVSGMSSDVDVITITCPIATTVGNAGTTLISYATMVNAAYTISAEVLSTDVSSHAQRSRTIRASARNSDGTLVVDVTETKAYESVPSTTLAVTLSAVGQSIRLAVVGQAGGTLHWKAKMDLLRDA